MNDREEVNRPPEAPPEAGASSTYEVPLLVKERYVPKTGETSRAASLPTEAA